MPNKWCGSNVQAKGVYKASCAKREGIANRDPSGELKNKHQKYAAKDNAKQKQKRQEMRKRMRTESGNEASEPTMSAPEIEEVRVKLVDPHIRVIEAIASTNLNDEQRIRALVTLLNKGSFNYVFVYYLIFLGLCCDLFCSVLSFFYE
jgi:hypothetical protein